MNEFDIIEAYTEKYCDSLELAYGTDMMSEGGQQEMESMFSGMNIQNKLVLDFGCGLGGLAIFLAKNYGANVIGTDINPKIIENATTRIPSELNNKITFLVNSETKKLPFFDNKFDLIVSKGVIVHLTNDQHYELFSEFNRILKPLGDLIIQDWLSKEDGKWEGNLNILVENEGLYLNPVSIPTYERMLTNAGFKISEFNNRSQFYSNYNREIVTKLKSKTIKDKFTQLYDLNTWNTHIKDYQTISEEFATGNLICGEFKAKKNIV